VLAALVAHPQEPNQALWLVCARPGDGQEPWYLLTSEPVQSADDAWTLVLAYARRWQIEMAFRLGKSELAMESPRLWTWERREKLLLVVTLAYAFMLSLLADELHALVTWLLRQFSIREQFMGELPVGMALIVTMPSQRFPFLAAAPTMRVPGSVAETINAYLSLRAALVAVIQHNGREAKQIKSLAVPGLCTGVGGMGYGMAAQRM
jgi:hypothetical protein